jgi:methionine-rich copper-binding protein CopC
MKNVGECRRSFFLRMISAVALAGCFSRAVFAHAKLVRSNPKDKARLTEPPKTIEFWFDERLENEFNTVEVFDAKAKGANRKNLAIKKAKIDSADQTHLILALDPLPPGDYVAEYRVLSRDSHTAPGRVSFSVAAK